MKLVKELNKAALESEISDKEAEEAFIKILKYIVLIEGEKKISIDQGKNSLEVEFGLNYKNKILLAICHHYLLKEFHLNLLSTLNIIMRVG